MLFRSKDHQATQVLLKLVIMRLQDLTDNINALEELIIAILKNQAAFPVRLVDIAKTQEPFNLLIALLGIIVLLMIA